jgi:integrase
VLEHAVAMKMIINNPARGIKKFRILGDGIHTWTEVEVAKFEQTFAVGTKPRLALELLLNTGQRRGDVLKMGWQHVNGDEIAVRQQKTDTPLWIPMHPKLIRALAAVPKTNLTFLISRYGKPFSASGFSNWFRECCIEAGIPQCSVHGLRKTAATRLANAGCGPDRVKAITGHKSLSEVERYTKAADQRHLARQAMNMLQAEQNKTEKLSNRRSRLSNRGSSD